MTRPPAPARRLVAAALGGLVAIAVALPALSAVLWTMSVTPTSVTEASKTAFRVRVENLMPTDHVLGDISCVRIEVPSLLDVDSVAILGTSVATPWSASSSNSGGSGTRVFLRAGNAVDHLHFGDWVEAEIVATADDPGAGLWVGWAYPYTDCSSGLTLPSIAVPLTVVGLATPTPMPSPSPIPTLEPSLTPTATPSPTHRPSAAPSPSPSPSPAASSRPSPDPSRSPSPSPSTGMSPSPSPAASPSLDPSPSTSASPPSSGAPVPPIGGGPVDPDAAGPPGAGVMAVEMLDPDPPIDGSIGVGLDALRTLDGAYEWLVPLFVVSVPGFLVILAIIAQSIVGLAWLVPTRRSLETDRRPARRTGRPERDGAA